ncbi:MAG: alanine--tRNA ligase [Acutalibacteraceae bacterium]
MQWTGLNELREKYLSFFESKGHLRLKSFPLVPKDDKSLLLINSGMAPMKKYFTGEVTPPRKRVTTCQKCIRTPDIEQVGKTARHGTYFEMLGNFSFGDYFKHEATSWAWEFCTQVLELPVDRIWVSIYEDDDEAFDIWTKEVGVSPDRIVRFGKEDNFWEHGSGPCGPCSELYFDRGEKYGCGKPDCKVGCECDRYVEFWNNVFTQFENDGNGNYTPLDHPNIDTGMGLERLACIMQDVNNIFEVDTVQNIMKHVSRIAGVHYGDSEKTDVSLRVITDHIRSTTFMIADGVMPSNEGRGYVLRRLLRRAARHGKLLGINHAFLSDVCDTVIEENKNAYPEVLEKKDFIKKLIKNEEESFIKTIDQGLSMLGDLIDSIEGKVLSGESAFKLYDTYGFPLDLTKDVLEESGLTVNEEEFQKLMVEQKERARNARKASDGESWASKDIKFDNVASTEFVGYEKLSCDSEIKSIIFENEQASEISEGNHAIIVLDKTPLYAVSGGQVADTGVITSDKGVFEVNNVKKNPDGVYMHYGVVKSGKLSINDKVNASVDEKQRHAIMRNHTAAHLLQNALRKVLGTHVEQAGQEVTASRLRFDFTHFSAMTPEELKKVEYIVNDEILRSIEVVTEVLPIEEAKKKGAMALFGEKYGDTVRVVTAGDSIEFCGGTHVTNTSQLGLFHIMSESSIASGVRRIEAVTGISIIEYISANEFILSKLCEAVKAGNPGELTDKVTSAVAELKNTERKLSEMNQQIAAQKAKEMLSKARDVKGVKIVAFATTGVESSNLRNICDSFKDLNSDIVAVIAGINREKMSVTFACACGKDAVKKGAHAGNIVREVAAITGGKGGGKPDSAMAGGKDVTKVDEALLAVDDIISKMIKE